MLFTANIVSDSPHYSRNVGHIELMHSLIALLNPTEEVDYFIGLYAHLLGLYHTLKVLLAEMHTVMWFLPQCNLPLHLSVAACLNWRWHNRVGCMQES